MTPALPPSSSTTFFLPARSFIRQPTDGEPVKVRSLNRSSATIRSPSSRVIGRMLTAPAGTPAASMISATVSITSGSLDGGLRTMGLPDAIAGDTLWAARFNGKLKGLMPAIGPIGKRRVIPIAVLGRGRDVERDELAGHPLGLLGAEAERDHGPVDLDERVADRLAGLERDQSPQLLATGLDAGTDLAQDPAPLVGGQVTRDLEGGDRRLDGLLVLRLGGIERRAGRRRRIRRVGDDERIGRVHPAPGEEDRVRLGAGGDGHRMGTSGRRECVSAMVSPCLKRGSSRCHPVDRRPS